jgi:hypothetical protein
MVYMDKYDLCKEIGQCFGDYWKEGERYCIDNGEETFRYKTPEALLSDWVETLIHQHIASEGDVGANWEEEVKFIYENVLEKYPVGVRPYKGKTKRKYKAEVYVSNGTPHGKMKYLGVYDYIIDAIEAVWKFKNII